MMVVVLLLMIVAALYGGYSRLSFLKKLSVKIILIYVCAAFAFFNVLGFLIQAGDSLREAREKSKKGRITAMEARLARGDYDWLQTQLDLYQSYEEEFEYGWERLLLYELYNQYFLYVSAASETVAEEKRVEYIERAGAFRDRILEICNEGVCPENQVYADRYREILE